VTLVGRQIDADVVGGVTMVIAVAALGVPAALVSGRRD
jgi:hypothetical protein